MAQLSPNAFLAKYNDAISGLYKPGQVEGIGSDDHRSLVQDIFDSIPFNTDSTEFSVPFNRLFIISGACDWDWVNSYFSLALIEAAADFDLNFDNQVLGSQGTVFIKKTVSGDVVVTIPTHQNVGDSTTTTTITLSGATDTIFRVDFYKVSTSSFSQVTVSAASFSKIQHLTATTVLAFAGQDIYQSTDAGLSWTVVYTTTDDEIIDFSFNGANGVLVTRSIVGSNYNFFIYTSSNSGDTFSSYSMGSDLQNRNEGHIQKIVYYAAGDFYSAGTPGPSDYRPLIYRINSNTATTILPSGTYGVASNFEILSTDLWVVSTNQSAVASKLFKRTGSTTFSEVTASPIGDNTMRSVAAATSSLVLVVGNKANQDPIIAKSVDGGATFAEKTIDVNVGILRHVDAVSATSFIVVGDNGIGYSTDSGETWEYFPTPANGETLSAWDSNDILITASTSVFKGFGSAVPDIYNYIAPVNTETIYSRITVTSAQLLNSFTTPVDLISAPGAGKFVVVKSVIGYIDYNSAAYAAFTLTRLRYENGVQISENISLANTYDSMSNPRLVSIAGADAVADIVNKKVQLATPSGDPTTGNSDLVLTLEYKIITI